MNISYRKLCFTVIAIIIFSFSAGVVAKKYFSYSSLKNILLPQELVERPATAEEIQLFGLQNNYRSDKKRPFVYSTYPDNASPEDCFKEPENIYRQDYEWATEFIKLRKIEVTEKNVNLLESVGLTRDDFIVDSFVLNSEESSSLGGLNAVELNEKLSFHSNLR